MKKIALFFLFCNFANAQKLSQFELLSSISDDMCTEFANNKQVAQSEQTLGFFMLRSVNKHSEDIDFYYGKNSISNENVMYKIGEDIAFHLGLKCPDIFENFFSDTGGSELLTITGKFSSVKNKQFLSFIVIEDSGKSYEFILFNNFENAFLLTDKLLKQNQKIQVSYYVSELFDAKAKKFVNYNIVTSIEKI